MATNTLEVTILDKSFRVSCPEEEQDILRASAQYLDKQMREVRSQSRILGLERIAVIVALNLSRDLLKLQGGSPVEDCSGHLQGMIHQIEQTLSQLDSTGTKN